MSDTIATYSFLPWLRQGLSNNITQPDNDNSVKLRASIPIELTVIATLLDGKPAPEALVPKTVQLYGPGDIVGIDSKAIVKTEPRNWITDFENNFLPHIEFYEEDFPWRYTPARQTGDRLRPWLTLVVLKEEEFDDGKSRTDNPLSFFKLKEGQTTTAIFPKPSELWAWAHVHVNKDLSNGAAPNTANADNINAAIAQVIHDNPDHAYSRLLCPRKLEANTAYHAFVIPSFESGRLAGLGDDIPTDLAATKCAWDETATIEFPYYYRWYFRTGHIGDFEYLVNLLKPKPADKKVGIRDIDVLHPGSNLPPITNPELNGVLKLGGALRVPFDTMKPEDKIEALKFDEWDEHPYPHKFSEAMANRINLADDYTDPAKNIPDTNLNAGIISPTDPGSGDPDPVITSPLYGRWHALQQRLLKDKAGANLPHNKNWVHELNLDPRFRVAAGLGTKVVQKGQEEYMQAAWEQVGKVVEVNNKIRWAQIAKEVSARFYARHLITLDTGKAFVFTTPVHNRIIYKQNGGSVETLTVRRQVEESRVPNAIGAASFRAMIRPRGPVVKKMSLPAASRIEMLAEKINNKDVIILPPKVDPVGAINLTDIAGEIKPVAVPETFEAIFKKFPWIKYLPLGILVILLLLVLLFFPNIIGAAVLVAVAGVIIWVYNKFTTWSNELESVAAIAQDSQVPKAVDDYPMRPNFSLSTPSAPLTSLASGRTDSDDARNFKMALKDNFTLVDIKFADPVRKQLEFRKITDSLVASLDPALTIPKRTWGSVKIPGRLATNMVEEFAPVMLYPEIDEPMYKPLAGLSSELFLPNINLVEQNSITLLENNQKFIESYMVGINHEMSRELLWREYPTDQRGSYFRQFWDVKSFLPPQPVPADIKEQLRDIPKIHEWSRINIEKVNPANPQSPLKNELGQHNLRALKSGKTQLVLVIRGELLKKYPTAVVYAHKADWGLNEAKVQDVKAERRFVELNDAEKLNPPAEKLKTPLFEAKVDPDIYFFGFDLDDEEARGKLSPTSLTDNPGWFFVIKERPGEPRFGMDIGKTKLENGEIIFLNWNHLSWEHVETPDGSCIELNKTFTVNPTNSTGIEEFKPMEDDKQAKWSPDTNAAELAYILYQVPVLVGVHASRMLPK